MAIHFKVVLLLLSGLFTTYVSGDVFLSIDCGADNNDFYTDENSIVWTGDHDLIQNGVPRVVRSNNSLSHIMDTLRVFTTRRKNCYEVKVDKGGQVLVRASFNYGNYDGRSSPPSFDLQFDGNDWATVQTSNTEMVYYEVIYVVKGDIMSVCVAQTSPDQFPFISALEVRSLDSSMYSHVDSNYALFTNFRVSYGTNLTIRYNDDPYDRIWTPAILEGGLVRLAGDSLFIDGSSAPDKPPQAILQNAVSTLDTNTSITLGTGLSNSSAPVYITWYFSEVTQLDSNQSRSFRIMEDNQPFSLPILPPYGNVTEYYVSNLTASSNTRFSLSATPDSTLPPIINAMEVYFISNPLTDGTNSNDVEGLVSLQNNFDVLGWWAGDPCLPAPYSWEWLNCTNDTTPRVTAMYLAGFGLSGVLPDFSMMDALEIVDLHNNSLIGPIPDFLGDLPNLRELVTGNPFLCTSGGSCQTTPVAGSSSSGKKSSKTPVILGTTIPILVVFWAAVCLFIVLRKRRNAAVASTGVAGTVGGANEPNSNAQEMLGKIGEAMINEFKVSMEQPLNFDMSGQSSDNQQVRQQSGNASC